MAPVGKRRFRAAAPAEATAAASPRAEAAEVASAAQAPVVPGLRWLRLTHTAPHPQARAQATPEKAEIVQLRFFAGLSHEEVAEIMGVSAITIKRHWRYARVWLLRQMEGNQDLPVD